MVLVHCQLSLLQRTSVSNGPPSLSFISATPYICESWSSSSLSVTSATLYICDHGPRLLSVIFATLLHLWVMVPFTASYICYTVHLWVIVFPHCLHSYLCYMYICESWSSFLSVLLHHSSVSHGPRCPLSVISAMYTAPLWVIEWHWLHSLLNSSLFTCKDL